MSYKISSVDSQKIILERNSPAIITGAFIIIGSIILLVGIGLNLFSETWEMPILFFRILLPLFGLLAFLSGMYIPKQVRNSIPEQLIFDHQKGALLVQMDKAKNEFGYIRYNEIESINIYVEVRSSGKSTSHYYHIYVHKKDGSDWYLLEFSNRTKAETVLKELQTSIPLHNPCTINEPFALSQKIEKKEGHDKTIIHWQNKVSIWETLGILIFSILFLSILSMVLFFDGEPQPFMYIVMGVILSVFLLVMTIVIRNLIKDAYTRYAVSVDATTLVYYEFNKKTGAMRNNKILPLQSVESIGYTFAPNKNTLNPGIKILTSENIAQQKREKENPLEVLRNLFSKNNKAITLSIKALNPVECLQLENWLQKLIFDKGNVTVK
jgi:ABC-type multidrug transport system fused ATPase/permease subunit